MLPELGSFAIILALGFSLIQAIAPLFKINLTKRAAIGQFIFLAIAMLALIGCFLTNDMTVIYVIEHSHALLPFIYKVGAAWGGHEGSLLLWCLILSGWTVTFVSYPATYNTSFHSKILMILGFISAGFILFLFATSNPFARFFPDTLINGEDLTPILQDPGLIFHPPMLYLGYVGFAIGFAFAIAALLQGKLEPVDAKNLRPWIILPWSFLSCGIVLGSWWAYRELGWGGWWFWDPVENASLLPWLSATALIHSLIVTEKRNTFKGWTILLAIITFTLSLIGTFLVRSGVLVSVHAFANSPTRGIFLLSYLTIIICGAFLLYAARIHRFYVAPTFKLFSRETFLLINSVILLTAVATILLGTLYPIVLDALNFGKISVGEPYFNTVFLPIILPLLLLMAAAPHIHWQSQTIKPIWKKLRWDFLLSLVLGFILPQLFGYEFHVLTALGLFLSFWIILSTIHYFLNLSARFELKHASMIIAHIGIAIIALGVTLNKSYSEEKQIKISLHDATTLADDVITFSALEKMHGANYDGVIAIFNITNQNADTLSVSAEQRIYSAHQEMLSKPGIQANVWRDIYIALGEPLSNNTWSVRLYYKPFVRWIWAGGFLLLLGGLCSLLAYFQKCKSVKNTL